MGAFLLSSGTKGKRYALPHARIMIHQPSGGAQGQSTDIQIQAQEIQRLKDTLNDILVEQTGKTAKPITLMRGSAPGIYLLRVITLITNSGAYHAISIPIIDKPMVTTKLLSRNTIGFLL